MTHNGASNHGMVIVGAPYSEPRLSSIAAMEGGSPYGAGTITGGDGARLPSDDELAIARFQGGYVAQIAGKLAAK